MNAQSPIDTSNATPADGSQIAVQFISVVFGKNATEQPVHFCSLGSERDGKHPFRKLDTRNPDEVTRFIARWDMHERGTFYCVSTLMPGSQKRNKESTAELPMLFADIDLKDVNEDVEEIERKLKALRFPPSIIVRSGNGIHAIWLLREALDVQADGMRDRIEADLRRMADLVGGDLQVCEVERLMPLPGTHNTKHGEAVISHPADINDAAQVKRYELANLEEWLAETSPIILRKVRPRGITVAQTAGSDPYADSPPKPSAVEGDAADHIKLGTAVIGGIRDRGLDIRFSEKGAWRCSGGIWTMTTDGMNAWLNVQIEKAIIALNYSSTIKLRNETRSWIECQPELWRDDVPWDQHGMVPTRSGTITPKMKNTASDIKRDVAGFLDECIVYDPDKRISVPDFCLAFATWFKQNKGEDRNVPSNESISKALISMADPMIAINSKELRDNKRRYYAGIALNEEGLAFHMAGYESRELDGKLANTTEPKGNVNSVMPQGWLAKPSVIAMKTP